jgi:nitroreductase
MQRIADHEIDPRFLRRWSPRAMSGAPLEREEVLRLLEAARWAPSSANQQPWRVAYAIAGTPDFEHFLGALNEGNRIWCVRAGALLVVASRTARRDGKPNRSHSFDTGAAWVSIALQGSEMGLVVHGMGGFDEARAREAAGVPAELRVECMVAAGRPGRVEDLPEKLREREQPSGRDPVSAWAFEGRFAPDRV